MFSIRGKGRTFDHGWVTLGIPGKLGKVPGIITNLGRFWGRFSITFGVGVLTVFLAQVLNGIKMGGWKNVALMGQGFRKIGALLKPYWVGLRFLVASSLPLSC